jgi:hypothetical protein
MTTCVHFDLSKNTYHIMHSSDEYDRKPITSILIRKLQNQITLAKWCTIFKKLNDFKLNEMVVHQKSLHNLHIHNVVH